MAMLVSRWRTYSEGLRTWRLTLLHLKGRKDLEMSSAISFYGKRSLSSFQARRQGQQVHPPTVVVVAVAAAVVVVVLAVHLHLRHVSQRLPVHNVRRVIRRRPPVLVRRV